MDSSDDQSEEKAPVKKTRSRGGQNETASRSDKSLCNLTEKFIELIENSGESLVDIADAAKVTHK